jgi:hypothetical protein
VQPAESTRGREQRGLARPAPPGERS